VRYFRSPREASDDVCVRDRFALSVENLNPEWSLMRIDPVHVSPGVNSFRYKYTIAALCVRRSPSSENTLLFDGHRSARRDLLISDLDHYRCGQTHHVSQ
jgi:hypothetical protein